MAEPVVHARGVAKTYGAGAAATHVFRGLDVEVRAATFVVILGPSGSGKSTLLNLLGLMDRPDEGDVLFSGKPTKDLSEDARSRLRNEKLGFIFQFDSLLPEFTALENVLMPARIALAQGRPFQSLEQARARALNLMSGLGLTGLDERLPNELSGGERQRAAICRALINRPTVLLADEPTGNLDTPNAERVFSDLKAVAHREGAAVIMVTHNEAALAHADRVLRMHDGALAE